MNASNEQRPEGLDAMHQMLCAYVLGETNTEERTAVEAALADSAELRAEKERLEGTIGLVQTALTGSDALSGDAMAEIMAAAGGSRPSLPVTGPSVWYRSPGLRAAAAVVGLLGGVAMIVTSASDSRTSDYETTASVDSRELAGKAGESGRFADYRAVAGSRTELAGHLATPAADDALHALPDSGVESIAVLDEVEEQAQFDRGGEEANLTPRSQALALKGRMSVDPLTLEKKELGQTLGRQLELGAVDETLARHEAERLKAGRELTEVRRAMPAKPVDTPLAAQTGAEDFFVGAVDNDGGDATRMDWLEFGKVENLAVKVGARGAPELSGGLSTMTIAPGTAGPSTPGPLGRAGVQLQPVGGQAPPATVALGGSLGYDAGLPAAQDGTLVDTYGLRYQPLDAKDKSSLALVPGEKAAEPAGDASVRAVAENLYAFSLGEPVVPAVKVEPDLEGGARGEFDYFRFDIRFEKLDDGRRRRAGRKLTQDELELFWGQESERVIRECRPRPNERPRDMFFRFWGDNPFEITGNDSLSTFSVDVDTASYALARRYLNEGHIPTKAQVRTEEFVNYFDADLPAPTEETFAIHTELAPSLFGGSQRMMLRVGVRGKEVAASERKPLALTFVVDTSGSMRENDRLELVKHAMRLLVGQLDARDSIAIVAFSKETRLVLPMTSAANHGVIESAIHPLSPDGSTNAEAGLRMGYEVGRAALDANAHNRVVFLSDGVANVGQTDQDRIAADVKSHSDKGLFLNTIGVGMNNHNDVFLEQLADHGDGICDYVDSAETAQRAIVERFTEAMVPIASDVKIQVEFDPAQVTRYRLLGYENRAIADKDFRNDKVDAGEVGAGHQIQALYELETSSSSGSLSGGAEKPLAKVMLRWKAPKAANQDANEVDVTEISSDVQASSALASFASASPGYRRTVLVAQFAEFLRRSVHARGDSYETMMQESAALAASLGDADFDEFLTLTKRAYALNLPAPYFTSDLDRTIDEYRRFQYLNHQLGELERERGDKELEDLRKTNEDMERKIREMIRTDLERKNG